MNKEDKPSDTVASFKYLGTTISRQNKTHDEIQGILNP